MQITRTFTKAESCYHDYEIKIQKNGGAEGWKLRKTDYPRDDAYELFSALTVALPSGTWREFVKLVKRWDAVENIGIMQGRGRTGKQTDK